MAFVKHNRIDMSAEEKKYLTSLSNAQKDKVIAAYMIAFLEGESSWLVSDEKSTRVSSQEVFFTLSSMVAFLAVANERIVAEIIMHFMLRLRKSNILKAGDFAQVNKLIRKMPLGKTWIKKTKNMRPTSSNEVRRQGTEDRQQMVNITLAVLERVERQFVPGPYMMPGSPVTDFFEAETKCFMEDDGIGMSPPDWLGLMRHVCKEVGRNMLRFSERPLVEMKGAAMVSVWPSVYGMRDYELVAFGAVNLWTVDAFVETPRLMSLRPQRLVKSCGEESWLRDTAKDETRGSTLLTFPQDIYTNDPNMFPSSLENSPRNQDDQYNKWLERTFGRTDDGDDDDNMVQASLCDQFNTLFRT